MTMYTIAETPEFQRKVIQFWANDERLDFFAYLSNNPQAGDVIPNGGGLRKIRWTRQGKAWASVAVSGLFITIYWITA